MSHKDFKQIGFHCFFLFNAHSALYSVWPLTKVSVGCWWRFTPHLLTWKLNQAGFDFHVFCLKLTCRRWVFVIVCRWKSSHTDANIVLIAYLQWQNQNCHQFLQDISDLFLVITKAFKCDLIWQRMILFTTEEDFVAVLMTNSFNFEQGSQTHVLSGAIFCPV